MHHAGDVGGGEVGVGEGREAGVGDDPLRRAEAKCGIPPGDLE